MAALRARIEPLVKAGQRPARASISGIDDFRIWPEADFPRTHTLKIKRAEVLRWAARTHRCRYGKPRQR